MNTAQLKDFVYNQCKGVFKPSLTKADVSYVVEATIDGMYEGITSDGKILLRGLGTLLKKVRKARDYSVRGQVVSKTDRETVVFKLGSRLKKVLKDE